MTYAELKNSVLRLINFKTITGTEVPSDYNDKADYVDRIASLANDCMMEVSTSVRKIPETIRLSMLPREDLGAQVRYRLPDNFFEFVSGGTLKTDGDIETEDGRWIHTNCYMVNGKRYLYLKQDDDADYQIAYYRYPKLLSASPADTDKLDNTPEVQQAVPYYVAAFLAAHDDAFLYSALYNKFEDKLQRMIPEITVDARPTTDSYAFGIPGF